MVFSESRADKDVKGSSCRTLAAWPKTRILRRLFPQRGAGEVVDQDVSDLEDLPPTPQEPKHVGERQPESFHPVAGIVAELKRHAVASGAHVLEPGARAGMMLFQCEYGKRW